MVPFLSTLHAILAFLILFVIGAPQTAAQELVDSQLCTSRYGSDPEASPLPPNCALNDLVARWPWPAANDLHLVHYVGNLTPDGDATAGACAARILLCTPPAVTGVDGCALAGQNGSCLFDPDPGASSGCPEGWGSILMQTWFDDHVGPTPPGLFPPSASIVPGIPIVVDLALGTTSHGQEVDVLQGFLPQAVGERIVYWFEQEPDSWTCALAPPSHVSREEGPGDVAARVFLAWPPSACANAVDDDGDGGYDYLGDAQCAAWHQGVEDPNCGLGFETALAVGLLGLARRRRGPVRGAR